MQLGKLDVWTRLRRGELVSDEFQVPNILILYRLSRDMVAGSKRRKEKPMKVKASPTDAGREGGSDGP